MEKKAKKSRLAEIPAWALSILTLVATTICVFIPSNLDISRELAGQNSIYFGPFNLVEIVYFIVFLIIVPIACFFICRSHPKSVWYTPLICNAIGIIGLISFTVGTIVAPDYGTTSTEWIIVVSSIAISVIGAIVGAKIGRRKINKANN